MTAIDQYQLNDRFTKDEGTVFLTGIQALARLPFEQLRADASAGRRTAAFVSGYPGSPLGGYGEAVKMAAKTQPDLPLVFRQGVNEEYAATAVMGSQLANARPDATYDGVIGIWYGKAPGVDRAADALRHATFAGTSMHGGAVAIVGDDPNAKSSSLPSSSAGLMSDMHMPVIYPGDPIEALVLGRHAIALSRATGLWTALKIVADVADATANMALHPERFEPIIPTIDGKPYEHHPDGNILTPFTLEIEREIIEVRYELARRYAADNDLNYVTVDPPDAWLGIMSSGITYREVREALSRLGLKTDADIAGAGIRLLKMGMPLPFNQATVRDFSQGLEEFLIIEEKHGILESLVKDALYASAVRPRVVGKSDEVGNTLFPGWGSLDADTIVPLLRSRLGRVSDRLVPEAKKRVRIPIPLAVERQPFYCSGCPHNRSTQVPEGTVVGAGVGCHTMSMFMDPERIGDIIGLTAMGNEGTQWIGMAEFVDTNHIVQNLGDGTFFHSGQLAIQAAIAADVNITYKLLYNGTVAMTGGQDPMGQLSVADLVPGLVKDGVARLIITADDVSRYRGVDLPSGVEVWERHRLIEAQELLATVPGVTVLIHDQACAAEARRARKRGLIETPNQKVVINQRICEGCGDCGEVSNCLSVQPVETEFGRKTKIDQSTCNLDFSCLEGDCPSFVQITPEPETGVRSWLSRRAMRRHKSSTDVNTPTEQSAVPLAPVSPAPVVMVPADDFAMRITGIGGTGVVTVAQIIGTAAMLDGMEVRGLDQIGLSQKAGPVVSDLRLSRTEASYTNRLGEQQADLLLAFDQLVAASPKGLLTCSPDRTYVVGSNSETPTGYMITHLDTELPAIEELQATIAEHTRTGHHWVDAQAVTNTLFENATTANIFVVGMACQAGVLPIGSDKIEKAIELNGVAVERNLEAFRWGRSEIVSPFALDEVNNHSAHHSEAGQLAAERFPQRLDQLGATGELRARLSRLAEELVAWGDESTATEWFDVIQEVAIAEHLADPSSHRLLEAVANGLFKLTAYKDEYEVARLMIDSDAMSEAFDVAGDGGAVAWKLHPPMLRALGYEKKISVGMWALPAIKQLAKRKRLRGSSMDPFGRAEVRRVERELPIEYVAELRKALSVLDAGNISEVIRLAELAEEVRGYEDIKLRNVVEYRAAMAAGIADLVNAPPVRDIGQEL